MYVILNLVYNVQSPYIKQFTHKWHQYVLGLMLVVSHRQPFAPEIESFCSHWGVSSSKRIATCREFIGGSVRWRGHARWCSFLPISDPRSKSNVTTSVDPLPQISANKTHLMFFTKQYDFSSFLDLSENCAMAFCWHNIIYF